MADTRTFSASEETVQQAYIAYYGRPADAAGLAYWGERLEGEGGLGAIIEAFGESEEFQQRFGELTTDQLVNNLYRQLFNRDAEPAGLDFYSDQLESGESSLQAIALTILNGAKGEDATVLDNKLAVANAFTSQTEKAGVFAPDLTADARAGLIGEVTSEPATVETATAHARSFFPETPADATVGRTFVVDSEEDAADGECAVDCSLREAVIAANANPGLDKITIPEGTFDLRLQGDEAVPTSAFRDLLIKDDLIIEGAGQTNTVIDAGGLFQAFRVDPESTGVNLRMSDLTLQNGAAQYGGAINNNGRLVLDSVTIRDNVADNGGGVLNTGHLVLYDSRLEGNTATSVNQQTGFGGAIWNGEEGAVTVNASQFLGNGSDFNGGAIYSPGELEIRGSGLDGNTAGGTGGAVDSQGGLIVDETTIRNNVANDAGGVASQFGGKATIRDSLFEANKAEGLDLGGGGGLFIYQADVTVAGTTFRNNTALGEGGGAMEVNGGLVLQDSQVIGNTAEAHAEDLLGDLTASGLGGGLLIIAGSDVDIANVTVRDNNAGRTGGGIYNDRDTAVDVQNTTVAKNVADREYGGGIQNEGNLTFANGQIVNNLAGVHGGGVATGVGTFKLTSTLVEGNTAVVAGGVFNDKNGTVELVDADVIGNSATGPLGSAPPGAGGGLVNSNGTVRISGGEIADNEAAFGGGISNNAGTVLLVDGARIGANSVEGEQNVEGTLVPSGDAIRNFPEGTIDADGTVEIVGVVLNSGNQTGLPADIVYDL